MLPDAEAERLARLEPLDEALSDAEPDARADCDSERVAFALELLEVLTVGVRVALAEPERLFEAVPERLGRPDGDTVAPPEPQAEALGDGDARRDPDGEAVGEAPADEDFDLAGDAVAQSEGVDDALGVDGRDAGAERDGARVTDAAAERAPEADAERHRVGVGESVLSGELDKQREAEAVRDAIVGLAERVIG